MTCHLSRLDDYLLAYLSRFMDSTTLAMFRLSGRLASAVPARPERLPHWVALRDGVGRNLASLIGPPSNDDSVVCSSPQDMKYTLARYGYWADAVPLAISCMPPTLDVLPYMSLIGPQARLSISWLVYPEVVQDVLTHSSFEWCVEYVPGMDYTTLYENYITIGHLNSHATTFLRIYIDEDISDDELSELIEYGIDDINSLPIGIFERVVELTDDLWMSMTNDEIVELSADKLGVLEAHGVIDDYFKFFRMMECPRAIELWFEELRATFRLRHIMLTSHGESVRYIITPECIGMIHARLDPPGVFSDWFPTIWKEHIDLLLWAASAGYIPDHEIIARFVVKHTTEMSQIAQPDIERVDKYAYIRCTRQVARQIEACPNLARLFECDPVSDNPYLRLA
jgi:hypothetical protein